MKSSIATSVDLENNSPSLFDVFGSGNRAGTTPINLTIGNPHLKPPVEYYTAMTSILQEMQEAPENSHGYITKDDPFGLCNALAAQLTQRFALRFSQEGILMTMGATGALDILISTLVSGRNSLNPPETELDEIIIIAPYFVEYLNLVQCNGGHPVVVKSTPDFTLDIEAIANAITPKTKAIIINSPNNPTGRIYSEESLVKLSQVLTEYNEKFSINITVIEDIVYESIVFSDTPPPSMVPFYSHLVRINSYSKSLSLAGERLGYLAVHPNFADGNKFNMFMTSLKLTMRMKVVHAPLLQQRIIARMDVSEFCDMEPYRKNIQTMYNTLNSLGFGICSPEGSFYLWATLPDYFKSETEFRTLAHSGSSPLIYLPGTLFGGNAYDRCIRFSVCTAFTEIERACKRVHEICLKAKQQSACPNT